MAITDHQSPASSITLRFHRRQVLKMMASLPAAGFLSRGSLVGGAVRSLGNAVVAPSDSTGWKPLVLNPHEWTTVRELCDWIIPADEESDGAADAGVPEFIDDWLNFQRGDLLLKIREGLTSLDAECTRQYGEPFANCERENQQHVLDRIAWPERAAPQDAALVEFFGEVRDLVLSGFYTSETGIRSLPYLGNEPQQQWQGCPTSVLERLALAEQTSPPEPESTSMAKGCSD